MLSNSSSKRTPSFGLQPTQAWAPILGLVLFTALGTLAGAGSIIRLAFPVGAFAIAVFLYLRYPVLYLGFTWWISFLTPWVRRVIDYRSGFDAQGLILTAPYLVALVTIATFFRHLTKSYREGGLPFVMAAMAVFYGTLVGLINSSPVSVARALLDWLTPVLFAFHLFVNWRDYPDYRQNIQRTFLWGVLVMGVYGVIQYLVAPEWDRSWLINTKLTASMGQPEPLKMRIWSTLHSPGPFATFMMAGLLLLFNGQGALKVVAAGAGYLSFLLTLVRTLWGAWFVGMLTLLASLKPNLQMRLIVTILIMAICVVPLTTIEPFATVINARVQSLSKLDQDNSAQVRKEIYENGLNRALSNGLGNGIGNTFIISDGKLETVIIDSGILDMFFTLGWFGTIPYLGGMLLILFNLFQYSEFRFDPFMSAARAISISCFITLPGGSGMLGFSGMIFWSFLAITMAAHKYYWHQRTTRLKEQQSVSGYAAPNR